MSEKEVYLSPLAERLIRELIARKREEKKREQRVKLMGWTAAGTALLILLTLFTSANPAAPDLFNVLQTSYTTLLVLVCLGSAMNLLIQKKKFDQAEKDYKELRSEVVDRYEEIWKTSEQQDQRYPLYNWLEKEHGVNLYHR